MSLQPSLGHSQPAAGGPGAERAPDATGTTILNPVMQTSEGAGRVSSTDDSGTGEYSVITVPLPDRIRTSDPLVSAAVTVVVLV